MNNIFIIYNSFNIKYLFNKILYNIYMSKKTSYEKCYIKDMNKYMKIYEKGQLKNRQNKKINSRKQAVAIAITISEKDCKNKFRHEDYIKIEERYNKDMYDINNKIKNDKLSYTTVKNGIKLYNYYKKKDELEKCNKIKNNLIIRIFKSIESGFINKLILNDVIKFLE
jgi:hypothetical protein